MRPEVVANEGEDGDPNIGLHPVPLPEGPTGLCSGLKHQREQKAGHARPEANSHVAPFITSLHFVCTCMRIRQDLPGKPSGTFIWHAVCSNFLSTCTSACNADQAIAMCTKIAYAWNGFNHLALHKTRPGGLPGSSSMAVAPQCTSISGCECRYTGAIPLDRPTSCQCKSR